MELEKNEILYDILPYVDSFLFFLNYEPLKTKYKNIYNEIQDDEGIINNFLSNYIREIIYNHILINNTENEEKKQQKIIFKKSPQKIFDFLLNELHKIYFGKEINNTFKIKPEKNTKEKAYDTFKNFMEQDKSYISENFYGIKSIEKKCLECKSVVYIYKYLKAIPIKIKDIKEENDIDFEKCIKKIQSKFNREELCPLCSKKSNMEIKIRIEKFPKIMIFVLYGNEKFVEFKIKNSIKHGEYELIGAEIKNKNNFFDLLSKFCLKIKNYKFIYNEPINEEIFEDAIPLVLIYKKRAQMLFDEETGENSKDSFCSSKTTDNYEEIKNDNVMINKIIEQKNNVYKIEKKNTKEKKDILLYFKFKKGEEEYIIQTDYDETFGNIIKKLKKNFDIKEIIEDKIFFNNKKINKNKTPKDYNIKDKNHFIIDK